MPQVKMAVERNG